MKILVVGSGGREHALAWKFAQSSRVSAVLCAPGNGGTATEPKCANVAVNAESVDDLLALARREKIDLTVVGPEAPLVAGIVDAFANAGLPCFGPPAGAALLEGSKVFSKSVMDRAGVPTAAYSVFTDRALAAAHIASRPLPMVIKADGLAAGKGVIIATRREEADEAITQMMAQRVFGAAGDRVIVEDFLEGEEASFLCFCDGERAVPLASSQDHKRVGDGDTGPNTGGMGAYSPAPVVTPAVERFTMERVIAPMLAAMKSAGAPFKGILYAGLMVTGDTAKVLEFNVRFGDPECQPLLMRLKSDPIDVMMACIEGRLDQVKLEWDPRPAVCIVVAAPGYPGNYPKAAPITGLDAVKDPNVKVFHAGTAVKEGRIVTNGGRVLGVTAVGSMLRQAVDSAYAAAQLIHFEGAHYRKDIAARALGQR